MWLAASTTTVTSLLLRRFSGSKSCRAALLLLIHQTSFFNTTTTTTTFNSSSSTSKFGGGGSFILHDQQQANNNLHTTTTTFNSSSSSKFGGAGTFILHDDQQQAANNLHTTTCSPSSSSSKFGDTTTFILQINEPSVGKKDDIKMFMLSSGSGDDGTTGEEDKDKDKDKDKDDDDDDDQNKKKKKKKVFKLDEDLGFSVIYKDFQLQDSIGMVGSCNGIICLHDPNLQWPQLLRDVYLWNPATRHFRILPQSIHIEEQMAYMAFRDFVGFGFDVDTQDYKVLRICPLVPYSDKAGGCMCRVQIYSLSTDSWRVLDGIDSLPLSPKQVPFRNGGQGGTYLNGSCFFLGTKPIKSSNGILDLMLLSFDFNKEIFTTRELPEAYLRKLVLSGSDVEDLDIRDLDIRDLSYLVVHNNTKPVVFRTPRIDFAGGYVFTTDKIDLYSKGGGYWQYSMWLINEQKDSGRVVVYEKKPWAKLREFRIKTKSKRLYSEPRCVSNDGELVLISTSTDTGRNKLMLFNLVTKKVTKDFTIGDRDCRAVYVYKESQVSIMGAGNAHFRWQLPTPGTTYKLNLDAHYTGDYSTFGIGLCLTSDTGGCIGVRSLKRYVRDAVEGEAQAMFEAIKWAKELQLSPIIVESDSKNMVSFFMEDDDDNNLLTYWSSEHAHSVLEEAKLLLKSSENSISFQYCSRSCNYVADIAAKLGRDETIWSCKDWKADSPGEVVWSLSKDLGLETGVEYV